jgi:hypothetical protein
MEVVFVPWPYDAVARGVALLDEKVPGWRERIKLGELALQDCRRCVLGQVYGHFERGCLALDLDEDENPWLVGRYGFCLPNISVDTPAVSRYVVLTAAWREAIAGGAQ